MSGENKNQPVDLLENRYLAVLVASRRARQLLDRAEKQNTTVDTEKVIQQALSEFLGNKVAYTIPPFTTKKKKEKD